MSRRKPRRDKSKKRRKSEQRKRRDAEQSEPITSTTKPASEPVDKSVREPGKAPAPEATPDLTAEVRAEVQRSRIRAASPVRSSGDLFGVGWLDQVGQRAVDSVRPVSADQGRLLEIGVSELGPAWASSADDEIDVQPADEASSFDQLDIFDTGENVDE